MSTHHHDQELIMALAEGTLDEVAAVSARADIAACPQCAQDLELQESAVAALGAVPTATLTEFESARLRRDLHRELGVFQEEVRFEPSKRQRRIPFAALGTAAAVLLAIVAVAPRLNLVGGEDAETAAFETIAPAATTMAPQLDSVTEMGGAVEDMAGAPDRTASPTTAAQATTTAPPTADPNLFGYYSDNPDLALLRNRFDAQDFDPDLARAFSLKDAGGEVSEEDDGDVADCLVLTLSNSEKFVEGFQFARGSYDGREAIFYVFLAEDLRESAVVVQAADNCEELARAGP